MPNYEKKIFYVTQAQYDILKSNGTVGSYTGIDSDATYFVRPIPDNYELFWDNNENQIQLLKNGVGSGDPITIQYAGFAGNAGTANTASSADTATKLATPRTIGGVSFDGSTNINLPGVNIAGNQNTSGNAATATKLVNARTIGGVSFNGTANINLPGVNITGNQNTTGSAATLTTPRTLTIGSKGKTFNGGANVAWTLAEIGAAAAVHNHLGLLYRGSITNFNTAYTEGTYSIAGSSLTGAPYTGNVYGKLIVTVDNGTTHNETNNWIWQNFEDTSGRRYFR